VGLPYVFLTHEHKFCAVFVGALVDIDLDAKTDLVLVMEQR